jgi:hypothetical protein
METISRLTAKCNQKPTFGPCSSLCLIFPSRVKKDKKVKETATRITLLSCLARPTHIPASALQAKQAK